MPTSQPHQISKIITAVIALNPESILDIGPGFGNYGVLFRSYLDVNATKQGYRYEGKKIDCIEAFDGYLTPLHDFIYDNIYRGNALEVIDNINSYDLVTMIDVLEHFTKEEGRMLVEKVLKKNRGLLVSIPKNVGFEGEGEKVNKYEAHLGRWSKRELSRLGINIFIPDETNYIVYIGSRKDVVMLSWNLVVSDLVRKFKSPLYRIPLIVFLYNFFAKRLDKNIKNDYM